MKKLFLLISLFISFAGFSQVLFPGGIDAVAGLGIRAAKPADDRTIVADSTKLSGIHDQLKGLITTDVSTEPPTIYVRGNTSAAWYKVNNNTQAFNQNNVGKVISYVAAGGVYTGAPTPDQVAVRFNRIAQTISATQTPVIIKFSIAASPSQTYIYQMLKGKGSYGPGATQVVGSDIVYISSQVTTNADIINSGNTTIIDLGSLPSGNYLTAANSASRVLSDVDIIYLFSYTQDGITYLVRFKGTPGTYGGSGTQLVANDLSPTTDSNATPTPTPTNLAYTATATNGVIGSSTGTSATVPLATISNAGLLSPAEKTLLANQSGINSGNNAANTNSNAYADAKVVNNMNTGAGTTAIAPSIDAAKGYIDGKVVNNMTTGAGTTAIAASIDAAKAYIDAADALKAPIDAPRFTTSMKLANNVTDGFTFFNTTDEITNTESGIIGFSSNVFTIRTNQTGSGGARALRLSVGNLSTRGFTISNGGSYSTGGTYNFKQATGNISNAVVQIDGGAFSNPSTVNSDLNILRTISTTGSGGYNGIRQTVYITSMGSEVHNFSDYGTSTNAAGTAGRVIMHSVDVTGKGYFASEVTAANGTQTTSLATYGQLNMAVNFVPYTAKTSAYTILSTDNTVTLTSGSFAFTVPTAIGITGKSFVLKNKGTGILTVNFTGGQNADNLTTFTLSENSSIVLESNGTNYDITGSYFKHLIANATTTALTSTTLNSTYPNVPVGYRVLCSAISAGGKIYTKYSENGTTDVWQVEDATIVP